MHADHLKLLFPNTFALTNIAWAATEGKGMIAAGGNTALVNDVLDRFADFLMRCHLGPGKFVASVCTSPPPFCIQDSCSQRCQPLECLNSVY